MTPSDGPYCPGTAGAYKLGTLRRVRGEGFFAECATCGRRVHLEYWPKAKRRMAGYYPEPHTAVLELTAEGVQ